MIQNDAGKGIYRDNHDDNDNYVDDNDNYVDDDDNDNNVDDDNDDNNLMNWYK
jgi:hypothetical protein